MFFDILKFGLPTLKITFAIVIPIFLKKFEIFLLKIFKQSKLKGMANKSIYVHLLCLNFYLF